MKKIILLLGLGILLIGVACDTTIKNSDHSTAHSSDHTPSLSEYEIDSALAVQWTTNWRNYTENQEPNLKHGFLLHNEEILEILGVQQGKSDRHIRIYMGLTDHFEHKIILVATDASESDMFNEHKGYYAYDFDSPCPTLCGPNPSPLHPTTPN